MLLVSSITKSTIIIYMYLFPFEIIYFYIIGHIEDHDLHTLGWATLMNWANAENICGSKFMYCSYPLNVVWNEFLYIYTHTDSKSSNQEKIHSKRRNNVFCIDSQIGMWGIWNIWPTRYSYQEDCRGQRGFWWMLLVLWAGGDQIPDPYFAGRI